MLITTLRKYGKDRTLGRMFVDGKAFGACLEDVARPDGVKIPGATCLPEFTYLVGINHSPKFGRDMLIIYNDKAYLSVDVRGVRFTGIRAHGGDGPEDTDGCILVGDKIVDDRLQGNKEKVLVALVREARARGEFVYWTFSEDPE